jgi:PAS domain S-box-containing protein
MGGHRIQRCFACWDTLHSKWLPPQLRRQDQLPFGRAGRQREIRGIESQWTKADGTAIVVRENVKSVRDSSGAILRHEGAGEDITERKQA